MASRRTNNPPPPSPPSVSPNQGIVLLQKQIQRGKDLLAKRPLNSDVYSQWETITCDFVTKAFGLGHPNIETVRSIGKYGSFPMGAVDEWWEGHRAESLNSQVIQLEGMVEVLQAEIELLNTSEHQPSASSTIIERIGDTRKIFVVHGHNEKVRETTARFLEKLRLEPVILHEKPNQGRTVIEKFTDHSDVEFAVVLLTADDRGGTIATSHEKQLPRARQNVVLELGFFLGRLGRQKVCALYEEGVEIPSDYSGVLFVKLDDRGAWKVDLAKEIKAAGIEVDMNLVF